MVLQVLNWDLSTVTPYTILNQLLTHKCLQTFQVSCRSSSQNTHLSLIYQKFIILIITFCPFQGPLEDLSPTIRLRAETLLALSCTENQFTTLPPTLVATGCFLAALSGVRSRLENGNAVLRVALESLAFVTGHSFQGEICISGKISCIEMKSLSRGYHESNFYL